MLSFYFRICVRLNEGSATLNEKTGRVLLITDKTLGNIEFRRNGLLFRDRSPAQQDCVTVLSEPDPTFPWLGHFIFHNLEANNGFPIEVLQLLNQKEIPLRAY